MSKYTKVTILLKDHIKHDDYNKRIIEYLNDRHQAINNNHFAIAIEIVDSDSINEYASKGVSSIPAMILSESDPYVYGVNSILSLLAKLEIIDNNGNMQKEKQPKPEPAKQPSTESFYELSLDQMLLPDEGDDNTKPSSVKPALQDFQESPLNEKDLESKRAMYDNIYKVKTDFRQGGGPSVVKQVKKSSAPIVDGQAITYDAGEAMFMKQIEANLNN
jgi:hypothetical protein